MSLKFKETFINGNLELNFKPSEMLDIDYSSIEITLPSECKQGVIWRFFVNVKYIVYSNQYIILKNFKKSKIIFDFILENIKLYEKKLHIENYIIEKKSTIENCFKCIVLTLLKDIYNNFLDLSDKNIKFYFKNKIEKYKNLLEQNFIIHYNLPYENNNWTPNWNLYIENERFVLENIDIYIDTFFKNCEIVYNLYLKDNLNFLYQRLKFLDSNTKEYKKIIFENLNNVTKKIFYSFPLNIIFKDYKKLLEFENTYKPNKNISLTNEDIWLLCILPEHIRCYLLGIPIFSSSIISEKNQISIIKKINNSSLKEYYKTLYKKNKYIINHLLFDLPVGNMTGDNEDFVDISYNSINHYNIDDIIIHFNNGIAHIFTSLEFKELQTKKQNFYNREPFNLIERVNYKVKNKQELIHSLNNRHIDIELNNTLESNFNNLKEILSSNDNLFIEKKHNKSILDMFFNQF